MRHARGLRRHRWPAGAAVGMTPALPVSSRCQRASTASRSIPRGAPARVFERASRRTRGRTIEAVDLRSRDGASKSHDGAWGAPLRAPRRSADGRTARRRAEREVDESEAVPASCPPSLDRAREPHPSIGNPQECQHGEPRARGIVCRRWPLNYLFTEIYQPRNPGASVLP
jgi:hypothetical protein